MEVGPERVYQCVLHHGGRSHQKSWSEAGKNASIPSLRSICVTSKLLLCVPLAACAASRHPWECDNRGGSRRRPARHAAAGRAGCKATVGCVMVRSTIVEAAFVRRSHKLQRQCARPAALGRRRKGPSSCNVFSEQPSDFLNFIFRNQSEIVFEGRNTAHEKNGSKAREF